MAVLVAILLVIILSAHDLFGCLERDSALSEPSEAENVTNAIGFSKKSAELVYCD